MRSRGPAKKEVALAVAALGVVFGDIGTSPLYAYETAFLAAGGTVSAALGTVSLVLWTLFLVVTVKYVLLVMRADYQGEGGIFALMAQLRDSGFLGKDRSGVLVGVIILGAALLYGDGAITPAISVLSAVEGIAAVNPSLAHWSMPAALVILLVLFAVQRLGTGKLGGVFGPVMLVWFLTLAALGIGQIWKTPMVLQAFNPMHGWELLVHGGWRGWAIAGAVVLAVTGAEALYADLGHFGRRPIFQAWRWVVFPSLILNYLGQAALVIRHPASGQDPNLFFLMVPWEEARLGLVLLATLATVIASQALISGVFSLSGQAMDLGYLPRMFTKYTSTTEHGQIFIPVVNFLLGVACVMLVLIFRNSSALANAYGIAVTGAMIATSVAFAAVVYSCWKRPAWQALGLLALLLLVDLPLFLACLSKLFEGGVVPVLLAAGVAVTMFTWRKGRKLVRTCLRFGALSVDELAVRLAGDEFRRIPGTQIFVVRIPNPEHAVSSILEQYRRVHVLGEKLVILLLEATWKDAASPCIDADVKAFPGGLWLVVGSHGYMSEPDVPRMMALAEERSQGKLGYRMEDSFFVVAREVILSCDPRDMRPWQRKFFAFMSRNVVTGPSFLHIPADRLILYNWLLRLEPGGAMAGSSS